MNRKPVWIAIVVAIGILSLGYFLSMQWVDNEYHPGMATKQAEQITQTLNYQETLQQSTANANQTQTAEAKQAAIWAQETQIAAIATMTAAPTPTPDLSTGCEASVIETKTLLNQNPGLANNQDDNLRIPYGARLLVDGRMSETNWVHVNFEGQKGFVQAKDIKFSDPNCVAPLYELNFLAGWLNPASKLILEDTFTANQKIWMSKDGTEQLLPESNAEEGAYLRILVEKQEAVFSTTDLQNKDISAFDLHLNLDIYRLFTEGFWGLRFFDNDQSYYQLQFYPNICTYALYENSNLAFSGKVDKKACSGLLYDLGVSVNSKQEFIFSINGFQYGPTKLTSKQNSAFNGSIYLLVNDLGVDFNYIVVTAPK